MKMRILFSVILCLGVLQAAVAAEFPRQEPAALGLSGASLDQMKAHFQSYVDDGRLAGLTTLVAKEGAVVHFETYGVADKASGAPLTDDAIFRIYSMTKPVTGVALMMLYEEGRFDLDDPVAKYIPAFGQARVFKAEAEGGEIETVPAKRPITIRDLMRHTAGLTYGLFGDTPVDKIYQASGVLEAGLTAEAWVDRLARQPLLYQPGEAWVYSFAVDVQGRLIEILSGQTLDRFFEERIFRPLGMPDTGFYITEAQAKRLVTMYQPKEGEGLVPYTDPYFPDYTKKPIAFSAGGGLVSTTKDYWRFAQMLANEGELDGVRLLKAETVALMARDQLPEGLNGIAGGKRGLGFGLDFAVVKDVAKQGGYGREGEFFWGGLANTVFWVDPREDVVAVLMTNIMPSGIYPLREEMHRFVYRSLGDE